MTRARGVSQTLRNTRHAAIDFRQDGNKKHKISMQLILDLKFKMYTGKYQNLCQSR